MTAMVGAGAAAAGAAAAVGGGVAKEVFDYNRENYMFDSEMRFQRFTAVRGFMNAQFAQYREDIRGMTELTAAKMDMNWTAGTLFMCVCAALSDAGRIGMHGAAPPGWLMALYSGHIFTCILYMATAMWLALHASMRAQCGALSLLTRKVRLPIPSMAQLDAARNFGSGFERQKLGDMFRVPFMSHPQSAPELPEAGEETKPLKGGKAWKAKDPGSDFNSTGRATVPSWVRDEQVVDKGLGEPATGEEDDEDRVTDTELPEHFKLYAQAQNEWWPYEIYARIMLLYGVMQFLFAVAYYSLGTAISELRGFWISWSLPGMFIAVQILILRLDTLQDVKGQTYLPHLEWAGHIAPYLAVAASTLEYRYTYNPVVVTISWCLVLACFFGHGLFTLRLLDIAWPHFWQEQDPPENPGHPWWPASWRMPPRFAKSIWIVAPPKQLEPGMTDMGNEAKALKESGGGVACRRRKAKKTSAEERAASKLPSTMAALKEKHDVIEGYLEELYMPNLWPHISKQGQNDVHEQHAIFNQKKPMYDALSGASPPEEITKLGKTFKQIEHALLAVDNLKSVLQTHEGAYDGASPFARFNESRAPQLPWELTRVAVLAVAFCWFFMVIATFVEMVLGPESLMKPPGEPPWIRDQKFRHWTPSMVHYSNQPTPDDYRLYTARVANYEEWTSDRPTTRLLSSLENDTPDVPDAIKDLIVALPKLDLLADAVSQRQPPLATGDMTSASVDSKPNFLATPVRVLPVAWPPMFEPQHLVCGSGPRGQDMVTAFTARGLGAKITISGDGAVEPLGQETLFLSYAGEFGPLAGSAWTSQGLEVLTKTGKLLICEENPTKGTAVLSCSDVPQATMPLSRTSRLLSAALTEAGPAGWRLAALQLEEAPGAVMLFKRGQAAWLPAGEIHVLQPGAQREEASRVGLAFHGEELLVTLPSGEVQRRHQLKGTSVVVSSSAAQKEWRSACTLPSGAVMRLAMQHSETEDGSAWFPELIAPN